MFNAVIAGNLGKDAETRQAGGSSVTNFNVAVEKRVKGEKVTIWVRCAIWGKRGESLSRYLTKGSKVCVSGSLSTREHEGKTYIEIEASDVTLMGGKSDGGQSSGDYGQQSGGTGYGASTGGAGGYDDGEIPFKFESRV